VITFHSTPDKPEPFGYKVSWLAVKARDPATVLDAIEGAVPSNWESGFAAVYSRDYPSGTSDPWLFVTPPVRGWILAVSKWFPYPIAIEDETGIGMKFNLLLSRMTQRFDEVQFFGSYRVVDFVCWVRAINGRPMRVFSHADGQVWRTWVSKRRMKPSLGFPISPAYHHQMQLIESMQSGDRKTLRRQSSLRADSHLLTRLREYGRAATHFPMRPM